MLLNPTGFAVIGASNEDGKVGNVVFNNLLKSKIKSYPVNPNTKKVSGRKAYPSVKELKGKVSHAVIAVPARIVPQVMTECGEAGVKVAIIISAGFSESGNNELEEKVKLIAEENNIRVLGPNVLGVIKPGEFNASFFQGGLKKGNVTFISQSGALGVGVLDKLISEGKGLHSFISVGNASDITITQALNESLSDKAVKCVIIYAESLKDGHGFMSVCEKSQKPVFILKAGSSSAGRQAATTHTGSLAGSDEVYTSAFKQCGAIRVNTLKQLINSGLIYEQYGSISKKALIITNAGGPGIIITDSLENNGFRIPKLTRKVINLLSKKLKGVAWSNNNPIDLIGDAKANRYQEAFKAVKNKKFYDFIIVLLTPQAMTEPLKTAKHLVNELSDKPVFACFLGGERVSEAKDYLKKNNVVVFDELSDISEVIKQLIT